MPLYIPVLFEFWRLVSKSIKDLKKDYSDKKWIYHVQNVKVEKESEKGDESKET